jgi:hypothetical protein
MDANLKKIERYVEKVEKVAEVLNPFVLVHILVRVYISLSMSMSMCHVHVHFCVNVCVLVRVHILSMPVPLSMSVSTWICASARTYAWLYTVLGMGRAQVATTFVKVRSGTGGPKSWPTPCPSNYAGRVAAGAVGITTRQIVAISKEGGRHCHQFRQLLWLLYCSCLTDTS